MQKHLVYCELNFCTLNAFQFRASKWLNVYPNIYFDSVRCSRGGGGFGPQGSRLRLRPRIGWWNCVQTGISNKYKIEGRKER